MSWTMLLAAAMGDLKQYKFSQRKAFWDALTERIQQRAGLAVAWPDALMLAQPEDWRHAARTAGVEIEL
jgi:hypothetical protein